MGKDPPLTRVPEREEEVGSGPQSRRNSKNLPPTLAFRVAAACVVSAPSRWVSETHANVIETGPKKAGRGTWMSAPRDQISFSAQQWEGGTTDKGNNNKKRGEDKPEATCSLEQVRCGVTKEKRSGKHKKRRLRAGGFRKRVRGYVDECCGFCCLVVGPITATHTRGTARGEVQRACLCEKSEMFNTKFDR